MTIKNMTKTSCWFIACAVLIGDTSTLAGKSASYTETLMVSSPLDTTADFQELGTRIKKIVYRVIDYHTFEQSTSITDDHGNKIYTDKKGADKTHELIRVIPLKKFCHQPHFYVGKDTMCSQRGDIGRAIIDTFDSLISWLDPRKLDVIISDKAQLELLVMKDTPELFVVLNIMNDMPTSAKKFWTSFAEVLEQNILSRCDVHSTHFQKLGKEYKAYIPLLKISHTHVNVKKQKTELLELKDHTGSNLRTLIMSVLSKWEGPATWGTVHLNKISLTAKATSGEVTAAAQFVFNEKQNKLVQVAQEVC